MPHLYSNKFTHNPYIGNFGKVQYCLPYLHQLQSVPGLSCSPSALTHFSELQLVKFKFCFNCYTLHLSC